MCEHADNLINSISWSPNLVERMMMSAHIPDSVLSTVHFVHVHYPTSTSRGLHRGHVCGCDPLISISTVTNADGTALWIYRYLSVIHLISWVVNQLLYVLTVSACSTLYRQDRSIYTRSYMTRSLNNSNTSCNMVEFQTLNCNTVLREQS